MTEDERVAAEVAWLDRCQRVAADWVNPGPTEATRGWSWGRWALGFAEGQDKRRARALEEIGSNTWPEDLSLAPYYARSSMRYRLAMEELHRDMDEGRVESGALRWGGGEGG